MVDIQCATAEIRRGKKERRKKETTGQKFNGLPYSIGRPLKDSAELVFSKNTQRSDLTQQHLLHYYVAEIRRILECCSSLWAYLPKYLSDQIESIQKRAVKLLVIQQLACLISLH